MANLGYIQITRACNQDCKFCSNPDTGQTISLFKAKKYITNYAKKAYRGVLFTGGEPTLHADLGEMIAYAGKKGIQSRVITNGQKTSDLNYLKLLQNKGLGHLMLSLYSHKSKVQGFLSSNNESLANIIKTLKNAVKLDIRVDIITVINRYNANHLSDIVQWLVKEFSFINHFVWNNLDSLNNKASQNPDTIPSLNDFELQLHKAVVFLEANQKTFRVERVPLCYLSNFEHCSTETRKIVKNEERAIYFLDDKGYTKQKGKRGFLGYKKSDCCRICFLNSICAGLHAGGKFYSLGELYPVFIEKEAVVRMILKNQ